MNHQLVISNHTLIWQLADQWQLYLQSRVDAQEYSAETARTYREGLNLFLRWAEQEAVGYTPDLALRWVASLAHLKPNTISVWVSSVRAFFNWCVSEGAVPANPFAGLRGGKRRGTTQRHLREKLTDEEARRVLASVDTRQPEGIRNKAIICLMLYCGLRQIEIRRAEFQHVRTSEGQLVLDVWGKGRLTVDELVVIANPEAVKAVYDWMAAHPSKSGPLFVSLSNRSWGERLSTSAIRHMVKAQLRAVGIVNPLKTTHSLRHTAISKAAKKAGIQKAQSVARHSSITTTSIYVHEDDRITDPGEAYIDYE